MGFVGFALFVLADATPAFAQIRRIHVRMVDEQRQPVQGASLSEETRTEGVDPWWEFYVPHKDDAGALLDCMRKIGR